MNVVIELTVEEVNVVLGVLGDRPYNQVASLITKIGSQANDFVRSVERTTPPEPVNHD